MAEKVDEPPKPASGSSADVVVKPARKPIRESLLAKGFKVLPPTGVGVVIGGVRAPKDKS